MDSPDGTVLRADVYRPSAEGRYPVIMTHGPYAKGLAFQTGFAGMWKPLSAKYSDAVAGSSTLRRSRAARGSTRSVKA
jgi:predicted acyl esterase